MHPHPARVRPIRFAPGALGEGLPQRPLILSPDHALLVEGHLIAARQLVNGASIAVMDVPSVCYLHVELERHAILLAEGIEAESYLDTGNRSQFDDAGPLTALHPDFARSDHPQACAPLATDSAIVRPIWERLAQRATLLGHVVSMPTTTRAADLRLVLPNGRSIEPTDVLPDGRHTFPLHGESGRLDEVLICSRHAVPADVRHWQDDRRRLGVAISGLRISTRGNGLNAREIPLDGSALTSGWHGLETSERQAYRWTDGRARLSLPPECVGLELTLLATAEYRTDDAEEGFGPTQMMQS